MARYSHQLSWIQQLRYRWLLRLAAWSKPKVGLIATPEPWTTGDFDRGLRILSGKIVFTGHMMDIGESSIWNHKPPSPLFAAELHGFRWLDDLATYGDARAMGTAQAWILDWIDGFGMGLGPGWSADVTGRRLIRWINHSAFLLHGLSQSRRDKICQSMALQTRLLSTSWRHLPAGRGRFEALAGLICAAQSLAGMQSILPPALTALVKECQAQIDVHGTIASRNPEELLDIFSLLTWVKQSLELTHAPIPEALTKSLASIAPVLRSLRHGDGTLARFHGGGQGSEYVLDQALAISGIRASALQDSAMGFARLAAGATSLIADAAAPPLGQERFTSHASTCAFELSVGRSRVIVNCGSGLRFGEDWHQAGRSTASHATLAIEGLSSSRFAAPKRNGTRPFIETPSLVMVEKTRAVDGVRLQMNHNGYQKSHGLIHARTLDLPVDSKGLVGEDELYAPDESDVRLLQAAQAKSESPLHFSIRFHLHPEVTPNLEPDSASVSLTLATGDIWVFRCQPGVELALDESVYFEDGRQFPRPSQQIVLTGVIKEITTRVRWSLAKASENPQKAS